jgi:hypothetical protein
MNDLSSAITSRYPVLLPTYYNLKEVVKEAQALHTIPLVRDSGEPQRNRLPTFLIGGTVVLVSICILITSYDVTDIYCTKINDIIKNR